MRAGLATVTTPIVNRIPIKTCSCDLHGQPCTGSITQQARGQTTPKHIWGSYWWSSDHSPALLGESVRHTLESLKYSKYFAQLGGGWVLVQSKKFSFVASGLLKVSSCASITLLRRGSLVASKTFKSSNVRFNTQGFSRRVCVALSRHTADSAVTLGRVLMLSYAG